MRLSRGRTRRTPYGMSGPQVTRGGAEMLVLAASLAVLMGWSRVLARPQDGSRDSCSSLAAKSNCHVFSCIDQQTTCVNSRTFRHSILNTFCHQLRHRKHNLTPKSQAWADESLKCIMQKMTSYGTNSNCPEVTTEVKRIFNECSAGDGQICHALRTDMTTLNQIFGTRYWLDLIQAVSHCPRRDVTRFVMAHLGL